MTSCERAIDYAKSKGIDECDSISIDKKITTIRITDSEIAEIKQNQEKSFCVRLIHQNRFSSVQSTIDNEEIKTINQAIELSSYSKPKNFWRSLPHNLKQNFSIENIFDKKIQDIPASKAADIAQEMINSAIMPKISSVTGSLNLVYENFEIANSHGLKANQKATYVSGIINADSDFGDSPVSGIGQNCCRVLDSFKPEIVGSDAAQMCLGSLNSQKCTEGEYSMIFEPYAIGEILAFVLASNFNLKTFSEKRSCFSDSLEKKIAVENLTLVDDPHVPDAVGSKSFDDEGIATKPNLLIEDGVFKNTYSDLFDAFREKKKSTGNASRPGSPMGRNAEPIPMSAPHNLVIKSKDVSEDEIIKDTKQGLLVGRLWYTYAVNPIKGDFSCTARSGIRIIKHGEVISAGKSFRIIHNLKLLLQNISAIANDSKKVLPWASLSAITPTIKVEKIKATPI